MPPSQPQEPRRQLPAPPPRRTHSRRRHLRRSLLLRRLRHRTHPSASPLRPSPSRPCRNQKQSQRMQNQQQPRIIRQLQRVSRSRSRLRPSPCRRCRRPRSSPLLPPTPTQPNPTRPLRQRRLLLRKNSQAHSDIALVGKEDAVLLFAPLAFGLLGYREPSDAASRGCVAYFTAAMSSSHWERWRSQVRACMVSWAARPIARRSSSGIFNA